MYKQDETAGVKEEAVKQRRRLSPRKIIAIIAAAVLLGGVLIWVFWRYDFYPRNMNWGMSVQEVLEREDVEFNLLERDWGILLESKEYVEFYGYEAKLVYAFVDDKLMSGYFYIYNDSIEEKEQTRDYIMKRLRLYHYNKIDALFGPYPVIPYDRSRETHMGFGMGDLLMFVEESDPFWKENVTRVYYESDYLSLWVSRNYR